MSTPKWVRRANPQKRSKKSMAALLKLTPPDENDLNSILLYCGVIMGTRHTHQPVKAFSEFMTDMIWGCENDRGEAGEIYRNYNELYKESKDKPDALMIYARAFLEHTIYHNTLGKL